LVPGRDSDCFLSCIQANSGAHPVSCPVDAASLFPGLIWTEHKSDHSPPFRAKFKNAWSCTSAPSHCGVLLKIGTDFFICRENLECRCVITEGNCRSSSASNFLFFFPFSYVPSLLCVLCSEHGSRMISTPASCAGTPEIVSQPGNGLILAEIFSGFSQPLHSSAEIMH
jgi:hypothetical protein